MDPITHEMRTLTYTTTNRASSVFETTCEFSNFVTVEGLKIPTKRVCTVSSPFDNELHTWVLEELRFNQVSPDSYFERQSAGQAAPAADSLGAASAMGDSAAKPGATVVDTVKGAAKSSIKAAAPAAGGH